MTSTKLLAAGVATAAAIGAVAGGITSMAADVPATVRLQPAAVGAPLPLDPPPTPAPVEPVPVSLAPEAPPAPAAPPPAPAQPATALPSPQQLTDVLTKLADAGVSYKTKENLVEGGIDPGEGHGLDHELRKAYRAGELPLTFDVTNIQPAGPNTAVADVAISGPKMQPPVSKPLTFVDQGGNWVLSHDSAVALVQAFQAR